MNNIKGLNLYQKAILGFMSIMVVVFTFIYFNATSKFGFDYMNTFLVVSYENGNTIYSARIEGKDSSFVVSDDNTVVFHHGDISYGPYTVKEDPTAIPNDSDWAGVIVGREIRKGDEVIFRGGAYKIDDYYWIVNEDGTSDIVDITYVTSEGIVFDENGNEIDPIEPSISTILRLVSEPQLRRKGNWSLWFYGVILSVINLFLIVFADELFRWNLELKISNVYDAEPSKWEIANRYISWTLLTLVSLASFISGLH